MATTWYDSALGALVEASTANPFPVQVVSGGTAAGTSASSATAVQGITGGVPVTVSGTVEIGAGTAAIGAVSVSNFPATQAVVNTPATTTQVAGTTSATINTFTSALAASSGTRKGATIFNTGSAAILVFFGPTASATTAASIPVAAGGSISAAAPGIVFQDNIAVASATASVTYVVISQ